MVIDGDVIANSFAWLEFGAIVIGFFMLIGIIFFGLGKSQNDVIKKG